MEKEKIEALINELKENFANLDLRSTRNVLSENCDDLSMHILLPDYWQKVKWSVDVCRRYGLKNTTNNALMLTECGFRTLAKHILSEGKYPAKEEGGQPASIH